MRGRIVSVLVVLAVVGGEVLHAQSLTPKQRATLDGRFERILRLADQGTLEAEIDRFSDRLRRVRRRAARATKRRADDGSPWQAVRSDGEGDAEALYSALVASDRNVQPVARRSDGTPLYEAIVYTEQPERLAAAEGVQVHSTFEEFATVRATPAGLRAASALDAVNQVLTPNRAQAQNDIAAAEVGARTLNRGRVGNRKYQGRSVLTCVLDSGIDWTHPDFTGPDGDSRIRYIWDQFDDSTSVPTPMDNDPSRFGANFNPDYGSEFLPDDIQNGSVNQQDQDGHGTHVAGTVASSGNAFEKTSGVERYRGMAPRASIVAVKVLNEFGSGPTSGIIDGVNYCKSIGEAVGKPVVLNMSLGTTAVPRDGTHPLAKATENIAEEGQASGMVVVSSAGNAGGEAVHTGPFSLTDSVDVPIVVPDYDTTGGSGNDRFQASLWTYEPGAYSISIYTPEAQDTLTVDAQAGAAVDSTVSTPRGRISVSSNPSSSGRSVSVSVFDGDSSQPPESGTWTVRIRAQDDQSTRVHGWFGDTTIGANFENPDREYTLGAPATSRGVIAVGNYVHRQRWTDASGSSFGFPTGIGLTRDRISGSSSRGPTTDGRQKPAVGGPGTVTASALSDDASGPSFGADFRVGDGEHQLLAGTSMSAPAVAGTAALLLQQDPTLSTNEVRDLLAETTRVDEHVAAEGDPWNPVFGFGKVNAVGALIALRRDQDGSDPISSEILAYEDAFGNADDVSESVGGNGAERLALRFTPTIDGPVTGTYLSVGPNGSDDPANELTDSLYVQVWSDDGTGAPEAPLGDRVAVPPAALSAFTPNFVELQEAGVSVEAGTDYHLVVTPKADGGQLDVLAETVGSTAGRSMTYDGTEWSGTGNDLVVRVQVRPSAQFDTTPPASVAALDAPSAEPNAVALQWDPVATSDLASYRVYRDTAPLTGAPTDFTPFSTLPAGTTSFTDTTATEGRTYYYRVTALDSARNESSFSPEAQAFLYPETVTVDAARSFGGQPAGASTSAYRLVALPGEGDRSLEETLSGRQGLDWQAFWDDGSNFVKFDGSDTFQLRPGRGFWVTSANPWEVEDQFQTVPLTGDSVATIPLHEGWNIVSNPTDKPIPVDAVQQSHGGTLSSVWGFEAGFFRRAETMVSAKEGRAYYFRNSTGLDSLRLPYPGAPVANSSPTKKLAKRQRDGPQVRLGLSAHRAGRDVSGSRIEVEIDPAASRGDDRHTVVAPPGRFEPVSLRLRPSSGPAADARGLLMAERRPPSDEGGHTFDLRLQTNVDGPIELESHGKEALGGRSAVLLYPATGETYDLRAEDTVTIDPEDGETDLRLAVGTEAYVQDREDSVLPDEVQLTTYPNPVQRQGTIEFALPEAQRVRLVLYDVLGRRVATLAKGRKEAGRHRVSLGVDRLPSGVYFGRLEAGDRRRTEKITVVR